jgi:hypothetical protein
LTTSSAAESTAVESAATAVESTATAAVSTVAGSISCSFSQKRHHKRLNRSDSENCKYFFH